MGLSLNLRRWVGWILVGFNNNNNMFLRPFISGGLWLLGCIGGGSISGHGVSLGNRFCFR